MKRTKNILAANARILRGGDDYIQSHFTKRLRCCSATRALRRCKTGFLFLMAPLHSCHSPRRAVRLLILRCFRFWALRLRFAAAEIGTQGLTQPFGLNPLFVLRVFCQLRSPIHFACPRTRCQIAHKGASRLTTAPSLRIGPTFCVCCCSSVVERVIGNDEVGSSILPSSTRKSPISSAISDFWLRAEIVA